jgi:cytochrome c oxidase subunit IV
MNEQQGHTGDSWGYIAVWLLLLALTAITITVASMHLGALSILTALTIASLKAGLVLWFFMHLKYEKRFFKLLLLLPFVTLAVVIGLTFFDVWFR